MDYISSKLGQHMPPANEGKVAVDSHPRLSGIMDTINATNAHPGKETKLPKEFYDGKVRKFVDGICVEEWFQGYVESREYRTLGIGALLGDIVGRMVSVSSETAAKNREGEGVRFGLSGCHDTTLAGTLASLGAFGGEAWPEFTSHIAIELFKEKSQQEPIPQTPTSSSGSSWFSSWLFGSSSITNRTPVSSYTPSQKRSLHGYYVRLRYNDRIMTVPSCKQAGNNLSGDPSFCTLVSPPLNTLVFCKTRC
jgi:acid phosphatase